MPYQRLFNLYNFLAKVNRRNRNKFPEGVGSMLMAGLAIDERLGAVAMEMIARSCLSLIMERS